MNIIEKDYCSRCKATNVPLVTYNKTSHLLKNGQENLHIYKMCNVCNTARMKKWRHLPGKMDMMYKITYSWSLRNKTKTRAHRMVKYNLKKGTLLKLPCEICGHKESLAHHNDYSKPLEVVWLCRVHHAEVHSKH